MSEGRPGTVDPLAGVKGIFAYNTLAPALNSLAMRSHQQDASAGGATEAGFKEMLQRHVQFAKCDGFNFH